MVRPRQSQLSRRQGEPILSLARRAVAEGCVPSFGAFELTHVLLLLLAFYSTEQDSSNPPSRPSLVPSPTNSLPWTTSHAVNSTVSERAAPTPRPSKLLVPTTTRRLVVRAEGGDLSRMERRGIGSRGRGSARPMRRSRGGGRMRSRLLRWRAGRGGRPSCWKREDWERQ